MRKGKVLIVQTSVKFSKESLNCWMLEKFLESHQLRLVHSIPVTRAFLDSKSIQRFFGDWGRGNSECELGGITP